MFSASLAGLGTGIVGTAVTAVTSAAVGAGISPTYGAATAVVGAVATGRAVVSQRLRPEAVARCFPKASVFRLASLWARGVASSVTGRNEEMGYMLDNFPLSQLRRNCIYANSLVEYLLQRALTPEQGSDLNLHTGYIDFHRAIRKSELVEYAEIERAFAMNWPNIQEHRTALNLEQLNPKQIMDIFNLLFYLAGLKQTRITGQIHYNVKLELLKRTGIVRQLIDKVVDTMIGTNPEASPYIQAWQSRASAGGDYSFAADQLLRTIYCDPY